MAANQHEALIRAYIDEVFNGHRVDALEKYWDDDLTSHWLGMETIHSLPAWRAAMEGFFAAFPDAAYTLDDMFFAGDRGLRLRRCSRARARRSRKRFDGALHDGSGGLSRSPSP
jgi:predicted ester cyclase